MKLIGNNRKKNCFCIFTLVLNQRQVVTTQKYILLLLNEKDRKIINLLENKNVLLGYGGQLNFTYRRGLSPLF